MNQEEADIVDVGGVGGTLAGNALSITAMRSTLEHVLTDDTWPRMIDLATEFRAGVEKAVADFDLPWSCTQLGARAEYRFMNPSPINGTQSAESSDPELEEYFHLYTANRGVLITPFHNMALMCRDTQLSDVEKHSELFYAACQELVK
jgi:glutamate-1-semialdehyde 2,1-aminomutase